MMANGDPLNGGGWGEGDELVVRGGIGGGSHGRRWWSGR
jgi:hypothetical protein